MLTFWKTLKYASFYMTNGQFPYQPFEESGEAYAKDTGHRRDIQSEKPSTNAGERPDNVLTRTMRDVGLAILKREYSPGSPRLWHYTVCNVSFELKVQLSFALYPFTHVG